MIQELEGGSQCVSHVQVVLGTESGMVTAIVRRVQAMLRAAGRSDVAVEIVFPVASEAITTSANSPADPSQGLSFLVTRTATAEQLWTSVGTAWQWHLTTWRQGTCIRGNTGGDE